MNTSIKISNQSLSYLLSIIGEALGKGKDLILHESINETTRYLYTEIQGDHKKILEMEGESPIEINQEENMIFSEDEISLMEKTRECPEIGNQVDQYYCNTLCPIRENCSWK